MNTRLTGLIVICAGALSLHAQTLRTAGSLAVDLDAATITAADGDAVTTWANDGTLGASFDALAGTTGAVFTNNLHGRKALEALAKPSQTQAVRLAYGRVLQEFLMMRRGAAEQAGETGLFPCF